MNPLLDVRDLAIVYGTRRSPVRAVDGVSFALARGETLALVGESGSGKTSVGRAILRLVTPVRGTVHFDGVDIAPLSGAALRQYRRRAQVVFQDPKASLDPRMRVGDIVREGIDIHRLYARAAAQLRVAELLEEVGLRATDADRHPHEFSGGERQRIAIARALAVEPEFLVLDEAVSALDVLMRAQVLQLLQRLQAARGLTYLFIAHDLAVVERIATRVAVMHDGRIAECAPTAELFHAPQSAAAQAMLSAIPRIAW